jgi:SEC-C motif-containing protein
MKSRYSAYSENNATYILKTSHKNNPEYSLNKLEWKNEIENFSKNSDFHSLEILEYIE